MSFRDNVIQEALKQKELKHQGQPIPTEYKKYARIAGLVIFLVSGIGSGIILMIGLSSGTYSIAFILLFAVLSLGGLIQVFTGKHLISRR